MRKIFLVAASLLILSSVSTAVPMPYAGAGQEAFAAWVRLNDDGGKWFMAMALRFPSDSGIETLGGVGRGTCSVYDHGRITEVVCIGVMRMRQLPVQAFTMDPALASAQLTVRQNDRRHAVKWTGKGNAPKASTQTRFGNEVVEVQAYASRPARASGTIYGTKLSPKRFDFADMFEGAITGVELNGMHVREISPNVYRIKKTFRIPN